MLSVDRVARFARVVQRKPVAWQDGPDGRQMVEARFRPLAEGRFGFDLGAYDESRTLIVDPFIDYATYLGAGDEPWLDLMDNDEVADRVVMLNIGPGRTADENVWRADLRGSLPAADSDPGEREWHP